MLFPGQGAQYPNMMASVIDMQTVQAMVQRAKPILDWDVMDVISSGAEWTTDQRYTAPIMLIADLAAVEKLRAEHPEAVNRCQGVAGFSVGVYAACVHAGVMSFEDALSIVHKRANAMVKACSQYGEPQCMMTVMGLPEDNVLKNINLAATAGKPCFIANNTFPDMFTVGG